MSTKGSSASPSGPFSMLPEPQAPWAEFSFSYIAQALLIAFFLWIRLIQPDVLQAPERVYRSVELVPTPVPVNHQPQPLRRLPEPMVVAKVDPPADALRLPAPVSHPKVKLQDDPAPQVRVAEKKLDPLPAAKVVIPKTIKTNVFSTGSSATPTIVRDPEHVQTGGFGDPNGVPAKDNHGKPITIAQLGSFDLPGGPGVGNGTGGANGVRGVVASAGFGNGIAIGDGRAAASRGAVRQAGFGDADVAAPPTVHSRPQPAAIRMVEAEIISKPTPAYTDEARRLKVEGEVLLEAVLEAGGRVRVLRVVRGLGHGLDDEAVRAAQQIHFKPAMQDGQPADSTVVLHIIFQLA
ncbi:MAG TPA: TonB family protein [Candidatus Sulfotelmatobacter sp.]|nr:TonB family protein [Candidatus Sulfotelmatobacter sp.]